MSITFRWQRAFFEYKYGGLSSQNAKWKRRISYVATKAEGGVCGMNGQDDQAFRRLRSLGGVVREQKFADVLG